MRGRGRAVFRGALPVLLVAALLSGCGNSAPAHRAAPSVHPAASPRTTAAPTVTTPVLHGPRIVIVMEENHSIDKVLGAPEAPRLAQLAAQGTVLSQFYATRHPSLPNYIALLSGDTYGIVTDCGNCHVDHPSLVDQLQAAHIGWRAYMQGLPAPCSATVQTAGAYARKHDPFVYFPTVTQNPAVCDDVVPFDQFASDADGGRLPQLVWVTPDLDHDMHGGQPGVSDAQDIATADQFLGQLVDELRSSPAWQQDTRVVVTWDEGDGGQAGTHGCCGGDAVGGHVLTLVVGPRVPHGTDATPYDHYALLRSIEAALGLGPLGHAADPTSHDIPALVSPTG
jgi:phospholipase C